MAMIALTLSLEELITLLKQNIRLPESLKPLQCRGNILQLPVSGTDGAPDTRMDAALDFRGSDNTFHLALSAIVGEQSQPGENQPVLMLEFDSETLLNFLGHNIRMPDVLRTASFDRGLTRFNLTLESGIALTAQLASAPGDIGQLQLRLDAAGD